MNVKQNLTNCANALSAAADAMLEAVQDMDEMQARINHLESEMDKAENLKRRMLQLLQEENG